MIMVQNFDANAVLAEKIKQAELLQEEIGLLQRVQEIELERNGKVAASKSTRTTKSTKIAVKDKSKYVKAEGGKRRGRPPGSKNVKSANDSNDDDGKSIDLQSLLSTIAQQTGKPLLIKDFVALALESGYTTKAKDFSNIVYQSVLKLVKKGVFQKNTETRAYEFVQDVA